MGPLPVELESLASLSTLHLHPGDVIVLSVPNGLTAQQRQHWQDALESIWPAHDSLILEGGQDISVLRTEPEERTHARPFSGRKRAA